jgi:DNA-directed RNA polymerase I subunit RPA49
VIVGFARRLTGQHMRDMRNDLGQTFGTRKARRAIASLTENAISGAAARATDGGPALDPIAALQLATIGESVQGLASRDELVAAMDESKARPRANLAADRVADVYGLDELVGPEVLGGIETSEWQTTLRAKGEVLSTSRFVAHRVQRVAEDGERLRALRVLETLLRFYAATKQRRGVRTLPAREDLRRALAGVAEGAVEAVRRRFAPTGEMDKFHVDLLMTHACALALLVDAFEVDVYDLREDLGLEPRQMAAYFREVGARVTNIGLVEGQRLGLTKAAMAQRKIAKLRLPLDFPRAKFSRQR